MVNYVISRHKDSPSAGFNDVPELIVKHCVQFIAIPLVHRVLLSFLTGYVPDILKIAQIKPIFKKGDELYEKIIEPYQYNRFFFPNFVERFNRLNSPI